MNQSSGVVSMQVSFKVINKNEVFSIRRTRYA